MAVFPPDERIVIDPVPSNPLFKFPLPAVVAVDVLLNSVFFPGQPDTFRIARGSGIVISPHHVLTAGHNGFSKINSGLQGFDAEKLRVTTSENEINPFSLLINEPPDNVVNKHYIADYNLLPGLREKDDIALFQVSNPLVTEDRLESHVIGLMAFVDPIDAVGLSINTAGYPGDNLSIPNNNNSRGKNRDLALSPGSGTGSIRPFILEERRFFYSLDVGTFRGQSGSGVWHSFDGEKPRILGVHTRGDNSGGGFGNNGVLITLELYHKIIDQIADDIGIGNPDKLPINLIVGGADATPIVGTYRRERIVGKDGDDNIQGLGAADSIEGNGGKDFLDGGEGDDTLNGGENNDNLFGGLGGDKLYGEEHNDRLFGAEGLDTLYGGSGEDLLNGGEENDKIYGEEHNDRLFGAEGLDDLYGGSGNDILDGGTGNDILYGDDDDDVLKGFFGEDFLFGGDDRDKLFGQQDNDDLLGEKGEDFLNGGQGNDNLNGGLENDSLFGGEGEDQLDGFNGVDQALYDTEFTNYDLKITDPNPDNPQFTIQRKTEDGILIPNTKDSLKNLEFGVFEFIDSDEDSIDDNGELFYVPLQIDPNNPTKLKDGPDIFPQVRVEQLQEEGNLEEIGTMTVKSPAWMFDGDVEYQLNIGLDNIFQHHNIALIIDNSATMDNTELVEKPVFDSDGNQIGTETESLTLLEIAKEESIDLVTSLENSGIESVSFGILNFNTLPNLVVQQDWDLARTTIDNIPAFKDNPLLPAAFTNYANALTRAQTFFFDAGIGSDYYNIAFFLSDGKPTEPNLPSATPPVIPIAAMTPSAISLRELFTNEVHAFKVDKFNSAEDSEPVKEAQLVALNIIDPNAAYLEDIDSLFDEIKTVKKSSITLEMIDRIEVKKGDDLFDTIDASELEENGLNLTYTGTINGLNTSRTAENIINFNLIFKPNDAAGEPLDIDPVSLKYKITTGQEQIRTQTENGTIKKSEFSINPADFILPSSGSLLDSFPIDEDNLALNSHSATTTDSNNSVEPEIVTEELDNLIKIGQEQNVVSGYFGDDTIKGSSNNDTLYGGEGNDLLQGNHGNDSINGNEGNDTLYGDNGDDLLDGREGSDRLVGMSGNDSLTGGEGDDTLLGYSGNDVLNGGDGDDELFGGKGIDTFLIENKLGIDIIQDFNPIEGDSLSFISIDSSEFSAVRADNNLDFAIYHDSGSLVAIVENVSALDLQEQGFGEIIA